MTELKSFLIAAATCGTFVISAASGAHAVTLKSCDSDSPDVSGTGGAFGSTLYSGQADPENYDFFKGMVSGDAVSSCTTVDTGGQAQYSASDLSGIDGVASWTEILKVDDVDTDPSGTDTGTGVTYDFNPLDGSFSFDAALGSLYDKMIAVFKNGKAEPETIVAYGLSGFSDGYQGEYVSMFFTNTSGDSWKSEGAVSNWALFGVKDIGAQIPVPAGLPLLLSALGLGGLLRLRQKRKAA